MFDSEFTATEITCLSWERGSTVGMLMSPCDLSLSMQSLSDVYLTPISFANQGMLRLSSSKMLTTATIYPLKVISLSVYCCRGSDIKSIF
jgi:hypothetical protein